MDAGDETRTAGDPLQKLAQGVSFGGRQRFGDGVFERVGGLVEARQEGVGPVGERDREGAAIVGMRHAFDQVVRFERVDDGHHRVAVDAEPGRQLTLGLAVLGRERHQHCVGPWVDAHVAHLPLKHAGDVKAQLGQQKRNALVERGDAGRPIFHAQTLALEMIVTYSDDHY